MKKAFVAFGILVAGVLTTVVVVRSRPQVEPVAQVDPPRLIRATMATATDRLVEVRSQGTIEAVTEATLVAEVAGTITWVSPSFVEGGFGRSQCRSGRGLRQGGGVRDVPGSPR